MFLLIFLYIKLNYLIVKFKYLQNLYKIIIFYIKYNYISYSWKVNPPNPLRTRRSKKRTQSRYCSRLTVVSRTLSSRGRLLCLACCGLSRLGTLKGLTSPIFMKTFWAQSKRLTCTRSKKLMTTYKKLWDLTATANHRTRSRSSPIIRARWSSSYTISREMEFAAAKQGR